MTTCGSSVEPENSAKRHLFCDLLTVPTGQHSPVFFHELFEECLAALFLEHDADGDGELTEMQVSAFLDNAVELLGGAHGRSGEILSQLHRGHVFFADVRDRVLTFVEATDN